MRNVWSGIKLLNAESDTFTFCMWRLSVFFWLYFHMYILWQDLNAITGKPHAIVFVRIVRSFHKNCIRQNIYALHKQKLLKLEYFSWLCYLIPCTWITYNRKPSSKRLSDQLMLPRVEPASLAGECSDSPSRVVICKFFQSLLVKRLKFSRISCFRLHCENEVVILLFPVFQF